MFNIEYLKTFIIYFLINLLYIITNCCKDILRQKGSRKQSMIMATISATIYVVLIKTLVAAEYSIIIIGTILGNLIGDYIGRFVAENLIKRGIVCYRFTIDKDFNGINNINEYLEENNFGYKWESAHSLHKEYLCYQIYTLNKNEDKQIESLLLIHNIDKFNRIETKA